MRVIISGKSLPFTIGYAAAAPYMRSFLIVGGFGQLLPGVSDREHFDGVYKYSAEEDEWESMPVKLSSPRGSLIATIIPHCHII